MSENLRFKSVCLCVTKLNGSHTAEYLAAVIDKVLTTFNIRNKVKTMTTDNASTMLKVAQKLAIDRIPCFAHVLNLIVQRSLNNLGLSGKPLINRNSQDDEDGLDVEFFTNEDEEIHESFVSVESQVNHKLIKKCRKLVGLFSHSTAMHDDLINDQKQHLKTKPLHLIQDVIKRYKLDS